MPDMERRDREGVWSDSQAVLRDTRELLDKVEKLKLIDRVEKMLTRVESFWLFKLLGL